MSRKKVKKKKPYVPGESAKADYKLFSGFFRSLKREGLTTMGSGKTKTSLALVNTLMEGK